MPALIPFIPAMISAGGGIASALIGKKASKGAAQDQITAQQLAGQAFDASADLAGRSLADNTADANAVISDAVRQQLEMYQPYMEAGPNSLRSLQDLAGEGGVLDQKFSFTRADLDNDQGFQFILNEGQKALEQSNALAGNLFSTGAVKNLVNWKMGASNQYFDEAFNRALKTFDTNRTTSLARANTLQDLVRTAFSGTSGAAGATERGASTIGSNIFRTGQGLADIELTRGKVKAGVYDNIGDAQAAGRIGSANALAGGITTATNAASKNISDWLATRKPKTRMPTTSLNRDESGNVVDNG